VIVMQRINDNDLSAHVLATKEEGYVHLKIEAEATGHQVFSFPRSPRVFTREPSDLLWEAREGPFEIRRQKAVMGKWKYGLNHSPLYVRCWHFYAAACSAASKSTCVSIM